MRVRNLSEICAKEAVQVYVKECAPLVWRPEKELQAFAKEEIPGGRQPRILHPLELPRLLALVGGARSLAGGRRRV